MFSPVIIGICLSLLLGALLGVQREIRQQRRKTRDFAGFRTYTFICLSGFLIGFLSFDVLKMEWIFPVSLFGVFLLCVASYYSISKNNKREVGVISQVVAILCFIIGILISLQFYQISISIAILITAILFWGHKLHLFARKLKDADVFATLKFGIIALIILPLLPNKNYTLLDFPYIGDFLFKQNIVSLEVLQRLDVFNFHYLWLMVVFISGIAFVGYVLMKTIGAEKGILVTGVLGGLMSSTALTSSFSIESSENKSLYFPLAIGVVIASSVMFFRVLFEVFVLNSDLFVGLVVSLGFMGLVGLVVSFILFYRKEGKINKVAKQKLNSPFSLKPALKFAFLFLVVLFVTKFLTLIFGNSGIYLVSFISGITDVDAITITLSRLALEGSVANHVAQFGIVIAAFANTFFKAGIAYYLGSKSFFNIVVAIFGVVLLVGGLSFIL